MKRSLLHFSILNSCYKSIMVLALLGLTTALHAHINPNTQNRPAPGASDQVSFRDNCDNAVAQIDQQINNVRARLTTGGDVWWDGTNGKYVVPKPPPGVPEVSSIFAGGIWLGGRDPGGNLKIAAQQFGRGTGNFDYYPGPLYPGDPDFPGGQLQDPRRGTIGRDSCAQWDKFFVVSGANVDAHVKAWRQAEAMGETSLDPATIPDDILGWPARGNRFFEGIHQFRLPTTMQGLAGYWDQDMDGEYEPDEGDYPIIEIRGCLLDEPQSSPDEMIFWIYNDNGNTHRESGSTRNIQMEIQVQAFAYQTSDDINNMTFQRYKLINRAIESIDSTYFGVWVDADLGCYADDYIGCDVDRSLAYVYNADQVDGLNGCTCDRGVNSYCDEVPILGVDYFRGPENEFGEELGMSSFTYINNGGVTPTPPPGTQDPGTPEEYYNYLSGRWRDGTPLTVGGDGYQGSGPSTSYAFFDPPNDQSGWSMCSEALPVGDRRTLQTSGPFKLLPGALNELIIGVVWVPDQAYPCPSLNRLQKADDLAQDLFDNCFELTRGPDAPDVDWVELDREIVAVFSNDPLTSNNAFEQYEEPGLGISPGQDSLYRFEGYKLFQLSGPDVSLADSDDPEKVRLVYQVDKRNGIAKIFNWEALEPDDDETPTELPFFIPELQVNGEDQGIRHTFSITEDQFAEGDRRLVNHRKYYFAAVAYAYNNYKDFDQNLQGDQGQDKPYLEGDRNIGDGENAFYTVIPRMILDRKLQSRYGDGALITRIDGVGTSDNFLDIADETRDEIESLIREDNADAFSGEVTYKGGFGPIDVSIFNPLEVIDGEYELTFLDDNMDNEELDSPTTWTLRSLTNSSVPVITSETSINDLNEQIIREFGFSVTVAQVADVGTMPFEIESNGARGYAEEYRREDALPWLFGIRDNLPIATGNPVVDGAVYDFIATDNTTDVDYNLDPNRSLSEIGNGFIVPYYLTNWRANELDVPYLTPAWGSSTNITVRIASEPSQLNNVDIVFTSDKDLWSRCVVVETMNPAFEDDGYFAIGERNNFDLRDDPSVTKAADENGVPIIDADGPADEREGMGWFPGYAIDVETGQRLNIFFGENSVYDCDNLNALGLEDDCEALNAVTNNGGDMIFNPHDEFYIPPASGLGADVTPFNYVSGGQHFIYVTNQPYDRCAEYREELGSGSTVRKIGPLSDITWAGMIALPPGRQMLSYNDGLIPEDVIVKLRVDNPYQVQKGTGEFNGYPTYRFKLDGKQADELDEIGLNEALQAINVIPNPYYGFSEYEDSQFENIVKISNLPRKCTVTIYSLDGKFIRKYERDEVGIVPLGTNRGIERAQVNPDLEWDLKNFRQIPIASGVYLIHVSAPGLGERTLKWFGVNRQFDPAGL
ncbi:MAG: hypothetical protein AAFP77_30980 [Bacteroidota bacterium]